MSEHTTVLLQHCLDRLNAGDAEARQDLLTAACARLTRLARKMFHAEGRLRQWQETGDVFQGAMLRLCRALADVTPASLREFFRLAALQVRRELIDLARHYYGPAGAVVRHRPQSPLTVEAETPPPEAADPVDSTLEPSRLAAWGEFHERIGALPEDEREVFDLVWYQGLTHAQAAALLQLSTKTIQRRWQAACLRLHEAMQGHLPGL
jgi:RNA polymerase sigma-70 factor (ECF subfamily)